ncbi:MAG: flagellar biosynthesis anti-sigma factor FlgM [Legionellaceae bacterium]|nr:flagellar biosynthesis anti-sigma factor FlgM [Legionellaceae bacterium]
MTKQKQPHPNELSHDFSEEYKQLTTLIASILHENEPNNVKIQIIKEEIEAGRYQINNQHIANKLMEYVPVVEEEMA